MPNEFNIAGKDWFTVDEAAHYCGVSVSQFKARESDYGLSARRFMGKKLYERVALYDAIAKSLPWDQPAIPLAAAASPLAPYRNLSPTRLRPYKPRKKSTD
ncbi:hypothetical protein J2T07_002734 [Luteibacter jiangsuensis]|uniref:Excisionase family DNA binding protein n=1 Tax=Luteibacter jiangsuensis TaxID=637577 RepID=A0ABT9SZV3_9GAMM|nr:hypothetical protein [Luteibacter jiangsuensis]MDQ0010544.1 hypothetical protein [Luteibacter jiangsuensis]